MDLCTQRAQQIVVVVAAAATAIAVFMFVRVAYSEQCLLGADTININIVHGISISRHRWRRYWILAFLTFCSVHAVVRLDAICSSSNHTRATCIVSTANMCARLYLSRSIRNHFLVFGRRIFPFRIWRIFSLPRTFDPCVMCLARSHFYVLHTHTYTCILERAHRVHRSTMRETNKSDRTNQVYTCNFRWVIYYWVKYFIIVKVFLFSHFSCAPFLEIYSSRRFSFFRCTHTHTITTLAVWHTIQFAPLCTDRCEWKSRFVSSEIEKKWRIKKNKTRNFFVFVFFWLFFYLAPSYKLVDILWCGSDSNEKYMCIRGIQIICNKPAGCLMIGAHRRGSQSK